MDFHSLPRKKLQALCKKNKIAANMTNVAMADALKALGKVEGVEETEQGTGTVLSQKTETTTTTSVRAPARRSTRAGAKEWESGETEVIEITDTPVAATGKKVPSCRRSAKKAVEKERVEDGEGNKEVDRGPVSVPPATPVSTVSGRRTSLKVTARAEAKMEEEKGDGQVKKVVACGLPDVLPVTPALAASRRRSSSRPTARAVTHCDLVDEPSVNPAPTISGRRQSLRPRTRDVTPMTVESNGLRRSSRRSAVAPAVRPREAPINEAKEQVMDEDGASVDVEIGESSVKVSVPEEDKKEEKMQASAGEISDGVNTSTDDGSPAVTGDEVAVTGTEPIHEKNNDSESTLEEIVEQEEKESMVHVASAEESTEELTVKVESENVAPEVLAEFSPVVEEESSEKFIEESENVAPEVLAEEEVTREVGSVEIPSPLEESPVPEELEMQNPFPAVQQASSEKSIEESENVAPEVLAEEGVTREVELAEISSPALEDSLVPEGLEMQNPSPAVEEESSAKFMEESENVASDVADEVFTREVAEIPSPALEDSFVPEDLEMQNPSPAAEEESPEKFMEESENVAPEVLAEEVVAREVGLAEISSPALNSIVTEEMELQNPPAVEELKIPVEEECEDKLENRTPVMVERKLAPVEGGAEVQFKNPTPRVEESSDKFMGEMKSESSVQAEEGDVQLEDSTRIQEVSKFIGEVQPEKLRESCAPVEKESSGFTGEWEKSDPMEEDSASIGEMQSEKSVLFEAAEQVREGLSIDSTNDVKSAVEIIEDEVRTPAKNDSINAHVKSAVEIPTVFDAAMPDKIDTDVVAVAEEMSGGLRTPLDTATADVKSSVEIGNESDAAVPQKMETVASITPMKTDAVSSLVKSPTPAVQDQPLSSRKKSSMRDRRENSAFGCTNSTSLGGKENETVYNEEMSLRKLKSAYKAMVTKKTNTNASTSVVETRETDVAVVEEEMTDGLRIPLDAAATNTDAKSTAEIEPGVAVVGEETTVASRTPVKTDGLGSPVKSPTRAFRIFQDQPMSSRKKSITVNRRENSGFGINSSITPFGGGKENGTYKEMSLRKLKSAYKAMVSDTNANADTTTVEKRPALAALTESCLKSPLKQKPAC